MRDIEDAEELSEDITNMAEASALPSAASDFASSVCTKACSIGETIDRTGEVSDRQLTALQNMRDGLARWFRD